MLSFREAVGTRIRTLREKKGWTQYQLEDEAGVNTSDLSFIENGRQNYCAETMEKIIPAFGMSEHEFYSGLIWE